MLSENKGVEDCGKTVTKRSARRDNGCLIGISLPKWLLLSQNLCPAVPHVLKHQWLLEKDFLFFDLELKNRLYAVSFYFTSKLLDEPVMIILKIL